MKGVGKEGEGITSLASTYIQSGLFTYPSAPCGLMVFLEMGAGNGKKQGGTNVDVLFYDHSTYNIRNKYFSCKCFLHTNGRMIVVAGSAGLYIPSLQMCRFPTGSHEEVHRT